MRNLRANQLEAQQRAELCFDLYLTMKPPRSLTELHRRCAGVGLHLSLNTLKNYSRRYHWQARVAQAQDAAQATELQRNAETLTTVADRHAKEGQTLQQFALSQIKYQMAQDPSAVQVSAGDIARLMTEGIKLERLALGEVTDRSEVRVQAFSLVVAPMIDIFADVARTYQIPDEAVQAFAIGAEKVVSQAMQSVETGEASRVV